MASSGERRRHEPRPPLDLAASRLFAAAFTASVGARAQDYPTRQIVLVVPYAAGGGNDAMARIVADKMSKTLGQTIVIENQGGAGGSIATKQVAKAAPDGYTLVIGGTGTLAINPTLRPNVGYDPRKDFAPVGLIATSALVVLVHPSVEATSIPELIALAKKEPGKLNYASAGPGSGIHLGTELFATMAGIRLTHVPYRGTSPALADLLGGHVQIYFSSLPPALGIAREGKVRALAVTGSRRADVLPELPTVAEAALPGYEAVLHYGIVAPGRHAAPDHRQAQRGAARRARRRGHQDAAGELRRRGDAQHAGGIRRRHRPRGDQVVDHRAPIWRQGELNGPSIRQTESFPTQTARS